MITVTARDAAGNTGTTVLTVTYSGDTTAPVITITSPVNAATYATTTNTVNLGGTASDAIGVTQVTWANDRGGSGTAAGTTGWSVTAITLQPGINVLTATARDAAGNASTDVLSVTYTAPDTTPPVVTITTPTSATTFSTAASTLTIGGTASDAVGVTQVTWTNDRGGSGTASGTTTWSVSNITLALGQNVLTVTARDAANNQSIAVLTVTYAADTTPPAVTITTPTSAATFTTTASTLNVGGTASDNVGVTQVVWANDRGGSGTATGTTAWSVSGIALQFGVNVITVTARDAANNTITDVLTVTRNDTTLPTVSITSPTTATTYFTSAATVSLGGTAADNVGVTLVSWSNAANGATGTASGTTAWTAAGIPLVDGANAITVTAFDAAGLSRTDSITVTRDTGVPTIAITSPTSGETHLVSTSSVALGGTAVDSVGVTAVTWTNATNGRTGNATRSGNNWTIGSLPLAVGANAITVRAVDAAGNAATDSITVTRDNTNPVVTITSPTTNSTYTTTLTSLNIGGTASDASGITQVTWVNAATTLRERQPGPPPGPLRALRSIPVRMPSR